MAIYKLQPDIPQPLGSLGGACFQRSCRVFAIRSRKVPVQKASPAQSVIKNVFASVAQTWRARSSGEKDTYFDEIENYPRINSLGVPYSINAIALMISQNNRLVFSELPQEQIITSPEPPVGITDIFSGVDVLHQSVNVFTMPSIVPLGFFFQVFASRPMSPGSQGVSIRDMVLIGTVPSGVSNAQNYFDAYVSAFGSYDSHLGSQVFFIARFIQQDSAQVNTELYTSTIILPE